MSNPKGRRFTATEREEKEAIIRDHLARGATYDQAASVAGVSRSTAYQWAWIGQQRMCRRYTAREKREALALVRGRSLRDVGRITGIPYHTIRAWCLQAEIDYKKRPRGTDDMRAMAVQMRCEQMSTEDIAAELGVARPTIVRWTRECRWMRGGGRGS